ncbi:2,3-bisphosphoglycerate-dependent phosphoglycerate mutase [Cupriavidus laharis]|uniref:2,3-bisphosphoglycerate-dependent phosphoglycerate mutase n=1 Tax=Cupriavidus laharis TaxID=151654 RepID=A0ABN7Y704_9BURK|nr:2,3-diphosphoglycerate-dependent phosphoglycerate mutase [Cupriavidus laharis]CAG9168067.1 2,3-bisphosphoglycerate-dependent phosphoglycerate mutase [Cupriavidus laharis]
MSDSQTGSAPLHLVLIRHGESRWNHEGRFTGWTDVDLTPAGIAQMHRAGRALAEAGIQFDLAVTSLLKRAIRSQWLVLDALDAMWIPAIFDWRLNERHYGALTGLLRADAEQRFGPLAVEAWRRSFDVPPPALAVDDPRAPRHDPRYCHLPWQALPLAESLRDTAVRVEALWDAVLVPALRAGKRILVSGHGNSLRALIKRLDGISDAEIARLDVPNGIPLVYHLDERLEPAARYYLDLPHPTRSTIL